MSDNVWQRGESKERVSCPDQVPVFQGKQTAVYGKKNDRQPALLTWSSTPSIFPRWKKRPGSTSFGAKEGGFSSRFRRSLPQLSCSKRREQELRRPLRKRTKPEIMTAKTRRLEPTVALSPFVSTAREHRKNLHPSCNRFMLPAQKCSRANFPVEEKAGSTHKVFLDFQNLRNISVFKTPCLHLRFLLLLVHLSLPPLGLRHYLFLYRRPPSLVGITCSASRNCLAVDPAYKGNEHPSRKKKKRTSCHPDGN